MLFNYYIRGQDMTVSSKVNRLRQNIFLMNLNLLREKRIKQEDYLRAESRNKKKLPTERRWEVNPFKTASLGHVMDTIAELEKNEDVTVTIEGDGFELEEGLISTDVEQNYVGK